MEVTEAATTEYLKRWDGRIRYAAARAKQKCPDPLNSVADIEQRLREAVWQAIAKWEESRGMSLFNWTWWLMNQAASRVVREQFYRHRDPNGNLVSPIRVGQTHEVEKHLESDDECEVRGIQVVDPLAEEKVDKTVEQEEIREKVREAIQEDQERDIYDMLVSGEHKSDRAIAAELGIPFSTVATVKLKAKIALALVLNIPLEKATDNKQAPKIARRFPALWAQYSLRA